MAANADGFGDRAVAIIGVGCRLPGGIGDLERLWEALEAGRDLVGRMPPDRFDVARFVDETMPRTGHSYTAAGGFLEDVTRFDAGYFGISPKEAAQMDPQQRLLLEMAAEALDDAGLDPARLAGTDAGVFVGLSDMSYGMLRAHAPTEMNAYSMSGGALSIAANRLSYAFDLRGPSMAIDTACSSSLIALERACRELTEAGDGRVALAGGVNVLINPYPYVGFSQASMLSRKGRCAAFSAEADGFVRAEGGAVLVLKRLAQALADGDRVHAVLVGWGANCDGRTTGLALPNPDAQEALLRRVYREAGVHPDEVAYVEAHGTGTPVGDPAECRALGRVLGKDRTRGPLPIGSVKSNLGHLEPASGMAGLLKALLVLRHGRVPASLHADRPSPDIDFADLGLEVVSSPRPIDLGAGRYVGVGSAGFGGANAHVIVAPAPERPSSRPEVTGALPVLVSARTPQALAEAAGRMADRLLETPAEDFYDLAYTSCLRRGRHPHRLAVPARDAAQAGERLSAAVQAAVARQAARGGRVGLVFSGNGAQWAGMGADLMAADAVFRDAVLRVDAALAPLAGWSVAETIASPPQRWRLADTEVAQPMLFAVQVGLTEMLRARGVTAAGATGHSVGEIAAAWAAGALSLEDAALVVTERSRAQQTTAGAGRMAAVGLPADEAGRVLARHDGLELAAVNSDRDVTVTGPADRLARLGEDLASGGVFFRMLDLDYAFHSSAMDPIRAPLTRALAGLRPSAPGALLVSAVTGDLVTGPDMDAAYWWRNVREPVLFAPAVRRLLAEGVDVLVEVGPHPVLRTYLRRLCDEDAAATVVTLRRGESGPDAMDQAVADLVAAGADLDWTAFFPRPGRVVSLPAYPWQRERHWLGSPHAWVRSSGDGRLDHPLLGERLPAAGPAWQGPVEPGLAPWLADHRVAGAVVWPATGYVEMALAAGRRALGVPVEVDRLELTRPLVLDWARAHTVQVRTSVAERDGTVDIASGDGPADQPRRHARGRVRALLGRAPAPLDVPEVRGRCGRRIGRRRHYEDCERAGLGYGPAFQVLRELHVGAAEVLAAYDHAGPPEGYQVHPALLDGALQAGAPLLADRTATGQAYLPARFDAVRVWRTPSPQGWVHVRDRSRVPEEACWDIVVTDPDGTVTVELDGVRLRRLRGHGDAPVATYQTVMRAAPHRDLPVEPSPLPVPSQVFGAAAERIGAIRRAWDDDGRERRTEHVRRIAAHAVHAAIAERLADEGAAFTVADVLAPRPVSEQHRWLEAMMPELERHDLATCLGDGRWRLRPAEARAEDLWHAYLADAPRSAAAVTLGAHLVRGLPAILRGERDPAEMLGASGAEDLLRQLHDLDPAARLRHRVARALLEEIVAVWPEDRPLRILEIGAGTGGLTAALLPALPADRTRYTCTDVSAQVPASVRQRLADHDFLDFRTLDLEADPVEQGFLAGGYDLVVTGDVLRCGDLRAVLRCTAALLGPGGHLLACASPDPCPVLPGLPTPSGHVPPTRERWRSLARERGFSQIVQVGDDQEVFLARTSPVRTTLAPPPPRAERTARGVHVVLAEADLEMPLAQAVGDLLTEAGARAVRIAPADRVAWAPALDGLGDGEEVTLTLLLGAPGGSGVEVTVRRAATLRAIVEAFGALPATVRRSLVVVTRPSGALPAPERPLTPLDAAAWGLARTLANEHTDIDVRRVSLERTPGRPAEAVGLDTDPPVLADARRLAQELTAPADDAEDEVVLTVGGRFAPREVERAAPVRPAAPGEAYRLRVRDVGLSYRLSWEETDPQGPPPPGTVTVAVRAVGLNYRDIVQVTGLLPPAAFENGVTGHGVGFEFAGVVTAVGADVDGPRVGDRVAGLASGALASHLTTLARATTPIPDGMDFTEAATLPVAYATVHQCLHTVARLRPSETVLVHGGAGGVGLAALRYARLCGAQVIATAGTEPKRDLLRALGAAHVFNSRTLDFVPEVLRVTGGRGVDVVVNSLAGPALTRGFELLAPGGRFLEIGKRDIFEDNALPLGRFAANVTFAAVDLDALLADPAVGADLLSDVTERVRDGRYPPLPHSVLPAARVSEAFELMRHSRHIGKVVVAFDPADDPVPVERRPVPPDPDPGGAYLVTGGLSGLGAATARHLADRGARRLALVSRRGGRHPEASALLAELAARGVHATAHAADCTDREAMARLIADLDGEGHRLRGVVHAAMHLDDDALADLTDERLAAVLTPKLAGGLVLDALTRERDLDLFCVYSSFTAALGNIRQAPYVAANLFLEALVRQRRRGGHPGLALAWGPIGDVGYVARHDLADALAALGGTAITSAEALTALDALAGVRADVAAVARMDWRRVGRLFRTARAPRFAALVPAGDDAGHGAEELRSVLAAMPPEQALATVAEHLATEVAAVMQMDAGRLDHHRRLDDYGLDSLMAAELISSLSARFDLDISPMELLNSGGTIDGLAHTILLHLGLARPPSPGVPSPRAPEDTAATTAGGRRS
ncbi:MAG TPA: SDR family NAD(P)-dependent oxidoreductase [Thermomonospora sp.]|nr:SDR family NAD(P)-dependent oxidoreductase [Thermomonospora sp.]